MPTLVISQLLSKICKGFYSQFHNQKWKWCQLVADSEHNLLNMRPSKNKWYSDLMKTIYGNRLEIPIFYQALWCRAPAEYQLIMLPIKQPCLICSDSKLIFAFFFCAKFKVSNTILACFTLAWKFYALFLVKVLCLRRLKAVMCLCRKSSIADVFGTVNLWNHRVFTKFRGVFRTKPNIYDGAFLRK